MPRGTGAMMADGTTDTDDDRAAFLQIFWTPLRERAGRTLTEAARAVEGIWACVERVPPGACTSAFERILGGLTTCLKQASPQVRRAAARLLVQAFGTLERTVFESVPTLPDELERAVPGLLQATGDGRRGP